MVRPRPVLVSIVILALAAVAASASHAPGPANTAEASHDPDGCQIEGDDLLASDAARARTACDAARGRFVELMGDEVPQVVVMIEARNGYRTGIMEGRAVVLWPSSEAMRRRMGGGPGAETHLDAQWTDVLRHEIAHALTAAHFFPDGRFRSTGYGTPLPDWFEEGIAIWAEPRASRESRIAAAGELPRHRLHLDSILTMRHPAVGDPAAFGVRDGDEPPGNAALWDFYQQSIAVLAFIHDAGGPRAVRALASRLRADPAAAAAAEVVVGLPGLPSTFREVEAAWADWLAGRAGAAGAAGRAALDQPSR